MSVENNLQISNISSALAAETWEFYPGLSIRYQMTGANSMSHAVGAAIFKKFINEKIPQAKSALARLGANHNIREFHLPLPLKTAFFVFIDELIEHYQNQIEQRDEKLNEEYVSFKLALAKNPNQIWLNDKKEINGFLFFLKDKLTLVDAIPDEFDETIALWSEVLSIQYVANMTYLAINLPSDYSPTHRLPISPLHESKVCCLTWDLSRGQIITACSLILHQISNDLEWIVPKIIEKVPLLKNKKLEENFLRITGLIDQQKKDATVCSLVQEYVDELNNIVSQLYSINFSDSKITKRFINRINDSRGLAFNSSLNLEDVLMELNADNGKFIIINGVAINKSHELFPHLFNYAECARLKNSYLDVPLRSLIYLLFSILESNESWKEFETRGMVPRLVTSSPLLTLTYEDADKSAASLIEDINKKNQERSSSAKSNGQKKAKEAKQNGKASSNGKEKAGNTVPALPANSISTNALSDTPPAITPVLSRLTPTLTGDDTLSTTTTTTTSTTSAISAEPTTAPLPKPPTAADPMPSTTTTTTTSTTSARAAAPATTANSVTINLDADSPRPTELLRAQLVKLFEQNPSRPLRQAIWHLDHLITIQGALAKSEFSQPEQLCLMAAVTNFAQKTLEQTYRYCLKQEQESFTTTHNLKVYHQQLDPYFKTYPPIVRELFLANHWFRYFYIKHKKLKSITTFRVEMPRVLDQLVKIADGQTSSPEEFKKIVGEMIENSCKHVEVLMKLDSISSKDPVFTTPQQKLSLDTPFPEKMFTGVQQQIEKFLANLKTNHPIFLDVKQTLAALKMLEMSIQKMNKANEIREFSTWTNWSLLQLQESMENICHCIEHYKTGRMSVQHELKTLVGQLGLEVGPLANDTHELSYKVRYPAEVKSIGLCAQIINDLEALKEFPDLEEGFKLQTLPKMLWAHPSPDVSFKKVAKKMGQVLADTERFLREKGVPALQEAHKKAIATPPVNNGVVKSEPSKVAEIPTGASTLNSSN